MALEIEKPLKDRISLAAESSMKGSISADKHRERISRLSECKKRSRQMANYIKRNDHDLDLALSLQGCANYMVFNNYYTIDQTRLSRVHTCKKHLLCPFCARLRGAKQVGSYLGKFKHLMKENPKLIPALLTFTIKNTDDLKTGTEHLTNSFRKFLEHRRQFFKKGRGYNELCKVDGAVFSIEATFNEKDGTWHPHLHALVLLTDYIDIEKLSAEWHKITGDSYIVDIRKLKGDSDSEMAEAFSEVFKYALKFSDLPLDKNLDAFRALRGKRLQGSFGSFRGVTVPETMTDELFEGLPYLELFYTFKARLGSYDLKKATPKTGEQETHFPNVQFPTPAEAEKLRHNADIARVREKISIRKKESRKHWYHPPAELVTPDPE